MTEMEWEWGSQLICTPIMRQRDAIMIILLLQAWGVAICVSSTNGIITENVTKLLSTYLSFFSCLCITKKSFVACYLFFDEN